MLREKLGMPLVLNGAFGKVPGVPGTLVHESGIAGLIDATRRAAIVIGVDSGPLHLAAALNKSGVAIFGPTDPVRNGPYGGDFQVFRNPGARTTHRRGTTIDASMQAIAPERIFAALAARVSCGVRLIQRNAPALVSEALRGRRGQTARARRIRDGGRLRVVLPSGCGSLRIGIPISASGIALRAWAAGHLAKNQRLATSGPYSFTRNPLYLGTLIAAIGLAAAARSPGLALLFALLFVLVYLPAIELEEQHLAAILPGYAAFAARVPLLIPRWPAQFGQDRFSGALYLRNREYQALLGWLFGIAWLIVKAVWIESA